MSIGCIITLGVTALGPAALAAACVFEAMARRLRKNPRGDRALLARREHWSDIGMVAGFGLWALGYVIQALCPDRAAWEPLFRSWMTWVIGALAAVDVVFVLLRRDRPRKPGQRKRFWEI